MPWREYFRPLYVLVPFLLAVSLAAIIPVVSADGEDEVPSAPPKPNLTYPNLSSHLNHLAAGYGSGGMSQQQAAGEAPVHSGGSVAVTIHLDGNVSDVVAFLEDNGGDPRNVGSDYIEAYVPVGLLGRLSEQPGVTRVWEITPPEPAYGNVTSQAVGLHQAGSWHNLGLRGQGVRVGVIDVGFTGYSSLMGVDLPANVVARCYTDVGVFTGNLADCEAEEEPPASTPAQCQEYVAGLYAEGEPHGTAVAEAVIDIAPDATLYIANPGSWADLQATAAWMADQGVTVINHSVGWILHGPGDGTSSISSSPLNTVDQVVARGVTWANAAGNAAEDTWFGSYSDPDGDGLIGFNISNDEINPLVLRECRRYTFQLRWEDSWGGANTDLDFYLWDRSTGDVLDVPAEWGYVGSVSEQSGASNHIPLELFSIRSPINSTDVGVIVVHESGPVPDWIQLQFWGPGGFEYHTVHGSIGTPAESANDGLLAVGAAPFYDTNNVEPFSSQGPTPDGRIKPDIVGVDCAASVTYEVFTRRDNGQDCWFAGTSQASPHVAGLAALVKQRFPDFSPEEVAGYLKDNAEERGTPGADNTWGHGFAVLPPLLGCDPVEVMAEGSPEAGTWGADCKSDVRTGRHARYFQFTLAESADVTVVLESDEAEPVLYLREGAGNISGSTTAGGFNDGEPEYDYHRASIEANLAAGTYTIEAATYAAGQTGDFTLTVGRAGRPAGPGPVGCAAGDITADGRPVAGSWGPDCESEVRLGRHARYFQFTLAESADVTVVLESDEAEPVLYLREGAGNTVGATTPGGFNDGEPEYDYHRASIEETLAAGTYTIEAATYSAGETGGFTLTVSVEGMAAVLPPPEGDCAAGVVTADGSPVAGSWGPDCESEVRLGRHARYYQFTLAQSADVTVVLESQDAETVLYLREGAGATSGATTTGGFNDGEPEYDYHRAVIEATLAAGTYTIEVTTYAVGETGSFNLTVSGAGATATLPPPDGDCTAGGVTADGSPVTGSWVPGCESAERHGRQARYYQFTLAESTDVTVVLESDEAEPVLYLREGAGATSGATSPGGFNEGEPEYDYHRAVIEATLAAGTYTIEATTYAAGESGSFTLTVSRAGLPAPPPPLQGCDPVEVPADGSPVAGRWSAGCESEVREDRQARYYQFTLAEGADIAVQLASNHAETVLYLREGAGTTSGDTIPGGFNDGDPEYDYRRASIETSLVAGTYTIEATTYAPGETGDFALIVSGAGLPATLSRLMGNAEEFDYAVGKHGGSLTYTTIGGPLTFNLAIATDSSSSAVLGPLFEGLTETSWLTNRVEPSLAESWEHSDDGLTWTFRLRDDVRWHDGTPFTARDVEFTFNRIIYNDDIPASSRSSFIFRVQDGAGGEPREARMTVTALNDHTVQIVLPTPFAPFLRSMGTSIYPKHILEPRVNDGTFTDTWSVDADPATVIGTGPFTIASYVPEQVVVLSRNPDYWLKDQAGDSLPYLDQIVQVIVPDLAAELAAFRAGESDSHGVLGSEFGDLYPLLQTENFTIHRRGPSFGSTFLAFNMNPGLDPDTGEPFLASDKLSWFSNRQFRQAVAHSIDKDAIINDVQHGLGYPQWASVSPAAGDFHNPNVRRYEYDIERARSILDDLGWVDTDGDGIREDADGNPITFNLTTNTGNTHRQEVGAIIHRGLQDIGIGSSYDFTEFGVLVRQLTSTYDWESMVIGFGGGSEPHFSINFWHSSGNLHLWHPNQAEPATDWEAEIDDLYTRGSQELDHDRRVALYHQAQAIAAENVPVIYTAHPERITAVRNVFGNTTATLYGLWDTRYLYRTD